MDVPIDPTVFHTAFSWYCYTSKRSGIVFMKLKYLSFFDAPSFVKADNHRYVKKSPRKFGVYSQSVSSTLIWIEM